MKKIVLSACAVFVFAAMSPANADFTFILADAEPGINGDQVNFPTGSGSNATGSATMTYDRLSGLFSWDITWQGLEGGAVTEASFRGPAEFATDDAGIQVEIPGLTSPSIGSAVITPTQAEDLLLGKWYIDIHTEDIVNFPDGEIRGQVDLAPRICKPGADTDSDGILDENDNCCVAPNGPASGPHNQTDTDDDGYGNVCDMDIDQQGRVSFPDVIFLRCAFFQSDPAPRYNPQVDCNLDGSVNFIDSSGNMSGAALPHSCMIKTLFRDVGPSCVDLPANDIGPECLTDHDADGISNATGIRNLRDNCTLIANPDQLDTDGDGFGNACDPDLNNDCAVDDVDTDIMMMAFFTTPGDPNWNPDADLNGDLVIDLIDLAILNSLVPRPGPSARPLAACSGVAECGPHPADSDGDGILNAIDNCTDVANPDQLDTNGDGVGNVCDPDLNNDCVVNDDDIDILMGWFFSPPGKFPDGDFNGDLEIGFTDLQILESYLGGSPGPSGLANCTNDVDDDDIVDKVDNCTLVANPDQLDTNGDGFGNVCDPDLNNDCVVDDDDIDILMQWFFSPPGAFPDGDFNGDLEIGFTDLNILQSYFGQSPGPSGQADCDFDDDDIVDPVDNCTLVANTDQLDTNGDGFGNVCDPDLNNDCVVTNTDSDIMDLAFSSIPGDPNWNPDADLNGDLAVGFGDFTILQSLFGQNPGPSGLPNCTNDVDDDDVIDKLDNCTLVANPDQLDTNGDGFGNVCDTDLNNDCVVDDDDVDILMQWFFSPPGAFPDGDFNGDLQIGIADLQILQSYFGQSPGPSGQAGCTAVP